MQTVAEQNADALATVFRIGAIRGASTAEIQKLLARFAERRIQEGLRVAGVIEEPAGGVDCGVCDLLILRDTAWQHDHSDYAKPRARIERLQARTSPALPRGARLSWPPSSRARMWWC